VFTWLREASMRAGILAVSGVGMATAPQQVYVDTSIDLDQNHRGIPVAKVKSKPSLFSTLEVSETNPNLSA
jgi:hypothetical protein